MDRDFRGIWIPAEIWLTKELTVGEKLMYVEIESLSRLQRGCFASNAHFADMFQISPTRASEIINSLASKGFVTIEQTRQGVRTVQRVIKVVQRINTSSENLKNPFGKSEEGSSENLKGKNTKINNTEKVKTLVSDERFDEFWKQYPNKKAKAAAEKRWKKISPDDKTFASIMSGLARHKSSRAWLKDNGEFIPHPATWLNERRWEDEIGAAQQGDKHSGFSGQRDYNHGTTRNSDGTFSF